MNGNNNGGDDPVNWQQYLPGYERNPDNTDSQPSSTDNVEDEGNAEAGSNNAKSVNDKGSKDSATDSKGGAAAGPKSAGSEGNTGRQSSSAPHLYATFSTFIFAFLATVLLL